MHNGERVLRNIPDDDPFANSRQWQPAPWIRWIIRRQFTLEHKTVGRRLLGHGVIPTFFKATRSLAHGPGWEPNVSLYPCLWGIESICRKHTIKCYVGGNVVSFVSWPATWIQARCNTPKIQVVSGKLIADYSKQGNEP